MEKIHILSSKETKLKDVHNVVMLYTNQACIIIKLKSLIGRANL